MTFGEKVRFYRKHRKTPYFSAGSMSLNKISFNDKTNGVKQAQRLLRLMEALITGNQLFEDDKLQFITDVQTIYLGTRKKTKGEINFLE